MTVDSSPSPEVDLRFPDFDCYKSAPAITSVEQLENGLIIVFADGQKATFHTLVLRENAPDEQTTHPVTREQRLFLNEISENLQILKAATERGRDGASCDLRRWPHGALP